ncbi:MAG: HEAT repeat domain-containing protein [Planctomycetes bacterium]|jgi:HEAT repeat protein|nr:HEAT repeat domain-containing protein [Planctomycetota bacterium]HON43941.1 HEAT repeat domain-containing protein [Planctomycetota bacterium]HPY74016.1 HEAT repeat domain-containing protein [Planctomycetota bacterium]HQB01183.1 HEAT repeat domain-containing protein [Planctomycetota bacterium]
MALWSNFSNDSEKIKLEQEQFLTKLQDCGKSVEEISQFLQEQKIEMVFSVFIDCMEDWELDKIKNWAKVLSVYKPQKKVEAFIREFSDKSKESRMWIFLCKLLEYSQNENLKSILCEMMQSTFSKPEIRIIFSLLNNEKVEFPEDILLLPTPFILALYRQIILLSNDENSTIRENCMIILGRLRENEENAILRLCHGLEDVKSKVCKAAATSLANIGEKSIEPLRNILTTKGLRTQISAAWCLGTINKNHSIMVEELFDFLGTPHEKLRKPVIWALEQSGESISNLLLEKTKQTHDSIYIASALKLWNKMPHISHSVAEYLKQLCEYPQSEIRIELLHLIGNHRLVSYKNFVLNSLDEEKENICEASIEALGNLPKKIFLEKDLSQRLVNLYYQRNNFNIRKSILQSITKLQLSDEIVYKVIFSALHDSSEELQLLALKSLSIFGEKAQEALPTILVFLENKESEDFILECLKQLEKMSLNSTNTMNLVMKFLSSPTDDIRNQAIATLESMGNMVAAPLLRMSKTYNVKTQVAISKSLAKLGPKIAPVLVDGLIGSCSETRKVAADALGNMGEAAMPYLCNLMDETDFWVKKAISSALSKIGMTAVPSLIKTIREGNNPQIIAMAIEVLQKMKQKALGKLIPLIIDPKPQLSQLAIYSMKKVNASYMESIPDLLDLFTHPAPLVRQSAAWCLGQIGHNDNNIIQALQKLQKDDVDAVAQVAQQSLAKLQS